MAMVYSIEEAKSRRRVKQLYQELKGYTAQGDLASADSVLADIRTEEHYVLGIDTDWYSPPRRLYPPWDTERQVPR